MGNRTSLFAITLCFLVTCPAAARKWTDNTGSFSVEADLQELRENEVVLKKADGTSIVVPLNRLSAADRKHLMSLSAPEPTKSTAREETPGDTSDRSEKPVPRRVGRQAIEQALKRPTTFSFTETPLSEAIKHLADQHQVQFYVDILALDNIGLHGNVPVTAEGQAQPLQDALEGVLSPLNLAWGIRNDVLLITTKEVEKQNLDTRVYALVRPVPNFDVFVNQLKQNVSPNSWSSMGGPAHALPWPGGAIVVSQTYSLHREIEKQFADRLRPVLPRDLKPTKPPVRGRSKPLEAMQQVAGCDFLEIPLEDAVKFLATQHKIEIVLDERALADEGIPPDCPVTLKLGPVPLKSTLALLLRPFDLNWTIRDGVLVITTREAAEIALVAVGYNVRDLAPVLRGNVDLLIQLITSTIAANSWVQVGGPGSLTADPRTGTLQIQQMSEVHMQIEQLLDDLRRIRQR